MDKPQVPKGYYLWNGYQKCLQYGLLIPFLILKDWFDTFGYHWLYGFVAALLSVLGLVWLVSVTLKFIFPMQAVVDGYEAYETELQKWQDECAEKRQAELKPQNIDENIARYKARQALQKQNRKWWHIF